MMLKIRIKDVSVRMYMMKKIYLGVVACLLALCSGYSLYAGFDYSRLLQGQIGLLRVVRRSKWH